MSDEEKRDIITAIHNEVKQANGKKTFWTSVAVVGVQVVLLTVTGLLVNWARGVNTELQDISAFRASMIEWKNQGPRYTPSDARVTKMEAVNEATQQMGIVIGRLEGKVEALSVMVNEQAKSIAELKAMVRKWDSGG